MAEFTGRRCARHCNGVFESQTNAPLEAASAILFDVDERTNRSRAARARVLVAYATLLLRLFLVAIDIIIIIISTRASCESATR